MTQKTAAYGLQLVLDGYGADRDLCEDVQHVYELLMKLPEHLGMRRVGFPHIIQIDEEGIRGRSGFTFIMESHISIHTYSERGFVTADVYSCKPFDAQLVRDLLTKAFKIQSYESNTMVRGMQFHFMKPEPAVPK